MDSEDLRVTDAPASSTGESSSPYVPLDGSPWQLSMGLHRLDPRRWLEVDARRAEDLRRKARLLVDARHDVLATLPKSGAAAAELLSLVVDSLLRDTPGAVTIDGDVLTDQSTGFAVDTAAMHPLEAAARVVQEDLCVLERVEGPWRLTAACVCFPSRWRLSDKIGETLSSIHGPVPGFESELARTSATFFDRLATERPVWRLNWTLLDTPELHLPSPSSRRASTIEPSEAGARLWFRVERQTLRRLASSGAIVFTIRTYVDRLDSIVASRPDAAAALRATLASVSDEVAAYKGWTAVLGPLTQWLDERVA
jgi:hypothetical protein